MFKGPQLFLTYSNSTATPYPTATPSGKTPSGSRVSVVTAIPSSEAAPYPILSSGPVTAAPSSYGTSNFPSAGNYTLSGTGSDQNTTTIHRTSVKLVTITRPRPGGCTINAPNANLLYWNSVTYNYTSTHACPILPESSGGTILAPIVTLAPYSFPVGLHAASTRFINFTTPTVVEVGNHTTTFTFINSGTTQTFTESAYTSTYTQQASSETFTGSGVTTTITLSGTTATGTGTAGTQTYTVTGNTQTGTGTDAIFSTPTFAGVTDVLRPDITYNGATYAYTATTPTPYVFFSVLEIQQASSTSTITVPVPFFSAYPGKPNVDWSGNSTATGALPSDLIGQLAVYEHVNISNCEVGTFRGQPTLDVGIFIFDSAACAAPARVEKTATGLGPISANPGGALSPSEPLTTSVAPAVPPPTDAGFTPAPVATTLAVTASSSPRVLEPVTNNPSSATSQAPGNSSPGSVTTSPVPQPPQQQTIPQVPKSPTTIASGLAGLILSGLGVPSVPTPGTMIAPVAIPGTPAAGPPSASTTLVVSNVPIAISSNNVIINSQTFKPAPGSPPVTTTVGNQPVVVNPSQVIAGGTTVAIPIPVSLPAVSVIPAQQPPVTTVGNSVITANSQSQFVVSGQTPVPGGPAITVGSTQLSLGPSASSVVIGSNAFPLQPTATVPLPTVAGQQIQTASNGNVVIPGLATLSPGANAATISGTMVSVMSNGAGLVVGGKTVALPAGAPSSLPTVAGQQIQLAPNGNIILPGGATVTAGGSGATISGTPVSLLPNGAGVVIGTSTLALPVGVASPLPTVGGQQLQKGPNGNIVIPGSTTLTPGGAAATIYGTVVSVASNGASVVVGASTIPLALTANALPSITFGGSTITENSLSQFVVAGQTLSPGSAVTVSGTVISLAPGASSVVVGGSTAFIATPTGSVNGSGNVTGFTGAAVSGKALGNGFATCMAIAMGVLFGVVAS